MTQLAQPFRQGEPVFRRDVSNVSLSPTTDNKKVTIALKGAGPSLSFQEDLAVGRSFQEARFETSIYESVFSNVEVSSTPLRHAPTLQQPSGGRGASILFSQVLDEPAGVLIIDDRSPATEPFRAKQRATLGTTGEPVFSVDEASLRALEAAERECEEDLREELRRERGLWKYARR